MKQQKQPKQLSKITKVTLVIYCLISLVCLICFLTVSAVLHNYPFLWGYLLCLGPGIIFVLISFLLPISDLFAAKVGKRVIALYIVAYIIKYAAVIGIPFIGITFEQHFNKWVMLATTLIAPLIVIIHKIIIANKVSKKTKTNEKPEQNSIKF